MIFFTCRALSSAATPVSPLPALLLTMVSPVTPWAISASMSSEGMPAVPKPPIITVAPAGISATAAAADATTLLITASSGCFGVLHAGLAGLLGDYRTYVRSTNTLAQRANRRQGRLSLKRAVIAQPC